MENASKALLMAASVLIGLVLLSLLVYLFISFGSKSAEMHKENDATRLEQFNTQFTSYEEKENTIYDVITVANLATENNKYYQLSSALNTNYYITVKLDGRTISYDGNTNENVTKEYNKMIEEEIYRSTELATYKCIVNFNSIGRANLIKFSKN